jgi:hypothetical protein
MEKDNKSQNKGIWRTVIGAFAVGIVKVLQIIFADCRPKVLAGVVIDSISGLGISQAEITVIGHSKYYLTEQNGCFKILFSDHDLKHVRIRVTKSGYKLFDLSFDLPNDGIIISLVK